MSAGERCDNVTIFEGVFAKLLYIRVRSKTLTDLASRFVTMSQIQGARLARLARVECLDAVPVDGGWGIVLGESRCRNA
jgi:hypothetical protein